MKITTAFFMATTAFLAGMMIGGAGTPAKKGKLSVGDNNFFGLKVVSNNNTDRSKKLPPPPFKDCKKLPEPPQEQNDTEE